VWLRYDNGHEAPLEPRQAAGNLSLLGWVPARGTAWRWARRVPQGQQTCGTAASPAGDAHGPRGQLYLGPPHGCLRCRHGSASQRTAPPAAAGRAPRSYRACAGADAIRAAIAGQEAAALQQERQRQAVEEVQRLLAAGEPIPERLLPAAVAEAPAAAGKKGEKEGGKKK
jgi:hypothetical protein